MKNQQSSVRFDHREIAVVFSLFIFVSLLMFTVGILVGKGLQQAKYEGHGPGRSHAHTDIPKHDAAAPHASGGHKPDAGTSITTGHDDSHSGLDQEPTRTTHHDLAKDAHEDLTKDTHGALAKGLIDDGSPDADTHGSPTEAEGSLELVPAHPKRDKFSGMDDFPRSPESEKILKDPAMAKYLEGSSPTRSTASVGTGGLPKSFAAGKFIVQVASYPNQREALERVEALQKLGFPFAYYSAKKLADKKQTWFRVWLGYFPDESSARLGGEVLLTRGEVTSYFVRKNENEG